MLKKFAGACVSAALLAACGSSNGFAPSTAMGGTSARHDASVRHATGSGGGYQILHSFGGTGDGYGPRAGLIAVDGVLYGTTFYGGTHGYRGGTAFTITPSGTENVLYDFGLGNDASRPWAGLTALGGVLYGTTYGGGTHGYAGGTVFSLTTGGIETVLHSFGGSGDGTNPIGGQLVALNGVMYGTTANGGTNGTGIVFSITPSGTESVLHSFGGAGDGAHPVAGLLAVNGVLYGTTAAGGTNGDGTVFSITTSGTETVVHSFGAPGDGISPQALTAFDGALYGTTGQGGAYGDGTAFSLSTNGTETLLYSFGGSSADAITPGEIHAFGGVFYGISSAGGAYNDGTVFSITTSGSETVLHSFGASGDGTQPVGIKAFEGTLYGTTDVGGAHNAGIVFALPIPVTETVIHSFGGGSADGTDPIGPLLNVSGTLYGTTLSGGASNAGTVYSVVPSYGTESVLHSFTGNPDGQNPYAGLITHKGTLYGTTSSGGAYGGGTVYSITRDGTESVRQSFYPGSDGQSPVGALIAAKSSLYGTTSAGGVYDAGTLFSIKTSGKAEKVFHSFGGGSADGTTPYDQVLEIGSTLYGTTTSGGAYNGGTVFAIAEATGKESVLHRFGGSSGDGANPQYCQLVSLNGIMYGTTLNGGAYGRGTIYSITPYGTETVLHSFGGGSGDGSNPYGGLINVNGTLYGTTSGGGSKNGGTLYSIAPYGSFTILWDFGGAYDGARPRSSLVNINGLLYGTTTEGGTYGGGTIFTLSL